MHNNSNLKKSDSDVYRYSLTAKKPMHDDKKMKQSSFFQEYSHSTSTPATIKSKSIDQSERKERPLYQNAKSLDESIYKPKIPEHASYRTAPKIRTNYHLKNLKTNYLPEKTPETFQNPEESRNQSSVELEQKYESIVVANKSPNVIFRSKFA